MSFFKVGRTQVNYQEIFGINQSGQSKESSLSTMINAAKRYQKEESFREDYNELLDIFNEKIKGKSAAEESYYKSSLAGRIYQLLSSIKNTLTFQAFFTSTAQIGKNLVETLYDRDRFYDCSDKFYDCSDDPATISASAPPEKVGKCTKSDSNEPQIILVKNNNYLRDGYRYLLAEVISIDDEEKMKVIFLPKLVKHFSIDDGARVINETYTIDRNDAFDIPHNLEIKDAKLNFGGEDEFLSYQADLHNFISSIGPNGSPYKLTAEARRNFKLPEISKENPKTVSDLIRVFRMEAIYYTMALTYAKYRNEGMFSEKEITLNHSLIYPGEEGMTMTFEAWEKNLYESYMQRLRNRMSRIAETLGAERETG